MERLCNIFSSHTHTHLIDYLFGSCVSVWVVGCVEEWQNCTKSVEWKETREEQATHITCIEWNRWWCWWEWGREIESVYWKECLSVSVKKRARMFSRVKSEPNEWSRTLLRRLAPWLFDIYRENLVESLHWLLCLLHPNDWSVKGSWPFTAASVFNGLVVTVVPFLSPGNSHRRTHIHENMAQFY